MKKDLVGMALGLATVLTGVPALAQVAVSGGDRDSMPQLPQDMRPTGIGEGRYISSAVAFGIIPPQPALCDRVGCVSIQNATRDYDITGIYFNVSEPDAPVRWSINQLTDQFRGSRLRPGQRAQTHRTGDESTCNIKTRFVLRRHKTGELLEAEGTVRLCRSAENKPEDAIYRISVTGASLMASK